MERMAKHEKLNAKQIDLLRRLQAAGKAGEMWSVDRRTAVSLRKRNMATYTLHWTVWTWFITAAGRAALDELATPQPAPVIDFDASEANMKRSIEQDTLPAAPEAVPTGLILNMHPGVMVKRSDFDNPLPEAERYQAQDKDAEIAELQAQLATLQQEHADLIIERDVLLADRKQKAELIERFVTLYNLMKEVDGQDEIRDRLFDPDEDSAMQAYGEWLCLMDSDVGILAQVNRTGQYAEMDKMQSD
jgi:hypothetical protein